MQWQQRHLCIWDSNKAAQRGKKKGSSWTILYLKGHLSSIIKIQFRVWTHGTNGKKGLALAFDVEKRKGGMSLNLGSNQ